VPRFIGALRAAGGEVAAIASRSAENAQAKANEWGIPRSYGSYEALLSAPDIDVVYVATINSQHYPYTLAALERGKHVICEKPFTLKASEARHLFEVARAHNLFLAEAQKVVFLPVIQDVKALIQGGTLGKFHLADLTSSYPSVYNTWMHRAEVGGGALYGSGCYTLHLLTYLFDSPVVQYAGLCTKGTSTVEEQCVLNLQLENDVLAVSKISTNVTAVNKAFLYGELGYIEIPDFWKARHATVHYHTGEVQQISYPCEFELMYELAHFNECIQAGLLTSPIMDESMTVSALEIVEGLRSHWG